MRIPYRPNLMIKAPHVFAILSNQELMTEVRKLLTAKAVSSGTAQVDAQKPVTTEITLPQNFWARIEVALKISFAPEKVSKNLSAALHNVIKATVFNLNLRHCLNLDDMKKPIGVYNLRQLPSETLRMLVELEKPLKKELEKNPKMQAAFRNAMIGSVLDSPTSRNAEESERAEVSLKTILNGYSKKGVIGSLLTKTHYTTAIEQTFAALTTDGRITSSIAILLAHYTNITTNRLDYNNESPPTETSRIYTKILEPLCEKFPEEVKIALRDLIDDKNQPLQDNLYPGRLKELVYEVNDEYRKSLNQEKDFE